MNTRPQAVLVTPAMPSDRGNGLAMRAGLLLAGLSRRCEVTVMYAPVFGPMPAPTPFATRLAREIRELEVARTANAELVVVLRTYLLPLLDALLGRASRPRIALDVDDIESLTHRQFGDASAAERFARLEADYLPQMDAVIACSRADAEFLGATAVIPNAIRMPSLADMPHEPDHDLVFVGNLSYAPNVEAAGWLCQEVLARLGDDMRVAIVGSNPHPDVRALAGDARVTVAPNVPDVTPWYARSSVAVVPVQRGGGSRIKLIEALAHRRPVVATTIGAAGLPWASVESPVVLADSPDAFAHACHELLGDPARAQALGARGATLVRERASLDAVIPQIDRLVRSMLSLVSATHPQRAEGIEVVPSVDGFVVYDPARDRVHYLNHTAALVLEFATGENSDTEITRMLQVAYDLPEPPAAEVQECLEQLRGEGLVGEA